MADEEENEAGSASKESKEKSAMGPLLALLGVCLIGAVLVIAIVSLLAGPSSVAEGGAAEHQVAAQQVPLLQRSLPMQLGDVMVNVRGQEGRRYVKVSVEIWFPRERRSQVEAAEIRNRIIQAAEQRLATFDMQELNSEFIHATMSRAFQDQINKELRQIYGTVGTDTIYVDDVVLTNLLIQ